MKDSHPRSEFSSESVLITNTMKSSLYDSGRCEVVFIYHKRHIKQIHEVYFPYFAGRLSYDLEIFPHGYNWMSIVTRAIKHLTGIRVSFMHWRVVSVGKKNDSFST